MNESDKEYWRCGTPVLLNNWKVVGDVWEDSGTPCYAVVHYVGGEDYDTVYEWYDNAFEAWAVAHYMNNTLPPRPYWHYYGE